MSSVAAIVAFPVAAAVITGLLRTPAARLLVKAPSGERWRMDSPPLLGGTGILAGLLVGVFAAVAIGATPASEALLGILAGCALLYLAGLYDDVRHLGPLAKLIVQFAAAGIVLATGTRVQLIHNGVAATALALLWLVGMTNAFNLLDNMDGLAATLAGIAAAFFAVDAVTVHPSHFHLVLALALALACAGFLPFNLRPGRPATVFMGDSGSQLLGFALASLGLSASWTVAGTTVATLLLPVLILAVPILDTGLVTVLRLLNGRPVTQGGRDHSSHRLVRYGLSEKHAVALLGAVGAALGATSLGYNVLDDSRVTLPGVLLTFVLLVQFASFLADLERRPEGVGEGGFLRAFDVHWRRLVEVGVDFGLISLAFLASYFVLLGGEGSVSQRHMFTVSLPILIATRYVAFILFGLYRSVWRYAGSRDLAAIAAAVLVSEAVTAGFIWESQTVGDFPMTIFVVDALICMVVVAGSRFSERTIMHALSASRRKDDRRTLIVGAGRSGRSLHRELRETPGERVVGYLDDNPRLRRRRIQGAPVLGSLVEAPRAIERTKPDRVLVTVPDAPQARLDAVLGSCSAANVPCGIVRHEIEIQTTAPVGAASK